MPKVITKKDTLSLVNRKFQQTPIKENVFLNSVPKCGTHLIKNIFRLFVPVEQQYHDAFIQYPILKQHLKAFDKNPPKLSWGHLFCSDYSIWALNNARHIIVVRDPYDWVLARTRFFLSDSYKGDLEHLRGERFSLEQIFNMMIFGIVQKAPTLHETFTHNAVAWLGTNVKLVKYEDLVTHANDLESKAAKEYFFDLLSVIGNDIPEDWKERIRVGADRKQSGTARENLYGLKVELPRELPEKQKQLVDYAAPGLRSILGYR
jgi:hypothetical protein